MGEELQRRGRERSGLRPLGLSAMALANQALFVLVNLILARQLAEGEFDRYCFAISVTLLLSTVATVGLEKHALRCLPAYKQTNDTARALGFWRFSLRTTLLVSFAVIAVFAVWHALPFSGGKVRLALAIPYLVVFMPAIALGLFMIEVVTATGGSVAATAVYRLFLPSLFLLLVLVAWWSPLPFTAITALLAFGISWMSALVLLHRLTKRRVPAPVWHATPRFEPREWVRRAVPFLLNSFLLTILAQSGVVILGTSASTEALTGDYAVALQLGSFVIFIATSTNRFYLPQVSAFMEAGDSDGMIRLARERMRIIGGISAAYVLAIVLFGRTILDLYGEGFRNAYPALCVVAAGAAVSTLFSIGPYFLQFSGRQTSVVQWTAAAVVANLGLGFLLAPRLGTLGVAVAYAVPLAVLFTGLRVRAWRIVTAGRRVT